MTKVYEGSEVLAMAVRSKLEAAGIGTVGKNNIQSATVAGFGSLGQAVVLYVDEENAAMALEIIANELT